MDISVHEIISIQVEGLALPSKVQPWFIDILNINT